METTWKRGQKVKVAKAASIEPQFLNDILTRRRPCPGTTAVALHRATGNVLGFYIATEDWLLSRTTTHPYFKPLENEEE